MSSGPIRKSQLQPGDVLLCKIPALSCYDYLSSIGTLIASSTSKKKFDWEAAMPLIHWLIGCLDEGHYFHAAFWNGSKLVQSRIVTGLAEGELESFDQDTVDVFRFQKKGEWLGSANLPVQPLLSKAEELVGRHWKYGFDAAYLLAILCVTRWPREHLFERLRDIIVHHAPADIQEDLRKTLDALRPQIDWLLEKILVVALNVVNQYLSGNGYVCSQTVAVIYNEAGDADHPVGTYKIPKPDHAARPMQLLLAPPATTRKELAACKEKIAQLRTELEKVSPPPTKLLMTSGPSKYEQLRALLMNDSYYTPRDLAESSAMKLVGRLSLSPLLQISRGTRAATSRVVSRPRGKAPRRRRVGI